MLQPKPVESFPTISIDRHYGDKVTDFQVDAQGLAVYLRDRGLNEDEIGDLSIHYSPEEEKSSLPNSRTLGRYTSASKSIEVFLPEVFFGYKAPLYEGSPQALRIDSGVVTESKINSTLIHELEHYLDDVSGETAEENAIHDAAASKEIKGAFVKYGAIGALGTTAVIAAQFMAKDEVVGFMEANGGHPVWSGVIYTAAGLGLVALSSRIGLKRMTNAFTKIQHQAYYTSPKEVKAFAAQEEYKHSFVQLEIKPVRVDKLEGAIVSSLVQIGEIDGTIEEVDASSE